MRYISMFVIALVVGLGFIVLNADNVRAQDVCEVTIEKVSFPANDTEFEFGGPPTFTLSDPSNPTNIVIVVAEDEGNRTTITEDVPSGWELESVECTPPTGVFAVDPMAPLLVLPSPMPQTVSI